MLKKKKMKMKKLKMMMKIYLNYNPILKKYQKLIEDIK